MKKLTSIIALGLVMIAFFACSDDDYSSRFPEISGVNITALNDSTTIVTIQTSSSGKNVYRRSCTWSVSPALSLSYDATAPGDNITPTCTLATPTNKGSYTITYKADYGIAGQSLNSSWSKSGNGTGNCISWTADYTMLAIAGEVTVTARMRIQ